MRTEELCDKHDSSCYSYYAVFVKRKRFYPSSSKRTLIFALLVVVFEAQCLSIQGRLNNSGLATLKSDSSRPLSAIIRLIHTKYISNYFISIWDSTLILFNIFSLSTGSPLNKSPLNEVQERSPEKKFVQNFDAVSLHLFYLQQIVLRGNCWRNLSKRWKVT